MALPVLAPKSQISAIVLPALGTTSRVTASLPFGVYSNNADFVTGASDQVAFTYKMLGGDVLDIELVESQVYAAYEEATLEYSYIVNLHQSKNVLSRMLGSTTGTITVAVCPGGISSAAQTFILYNTYIGNNDSLILTLGLSLATTDQIVVSASTSSFSFVLSGSGGKPRFYRNFCGANPKYSRRHCKLL